MSPTKSEIKTWLKRTGRNREWLGEQCGAKKSTVNNWLSTEIEVPAKALLIIEGLMRADAENAPAPAPVEQIDMPIRVSVQQFDAYTAAFKRSEQETLRGWMINRLDTAAADELGETSSHLKVANDPAEYGSGDQQAQA